MSVLGVMPKPKGLCQPWLCKEDQGDVTFESVTDRITTGNLCPVLLLTGQAGCWLMTRRCLWHLNCFAMSDVPIPTTAAIATVSYHQDEKETPQQQGYQAVAAQFLLSLLLELRRGEGMGNGGQAPKKRRCCSWDKEVKETSLFSLRHKEVKSDVSLSTSETKTQWRRSLWSIRGRCSKIKSWKTEIQGRRLVGVLTKWVGVTWYTSWRAVDSCPITRNFQIWTVYLGSSFVTSTLPEEVFMWSCIKEQSNWKITKISPGLKPVFTVAVYSFLICFCQWSSWDTLCHVVQTF